MVSDGAVLVTGALGCIGSWTVKHLVAGGARVIAVDLGADRSRLHLVAGGDIDDAVTFDRCDVTDRDALLHLARKHEIATIIHLAALQVPASHANPPAGAAVNVVGTANVLDVARHSDVSQVVFASSVAVYGPELIGSTVTEDSDQRPNNFYGVYKRADEGVARLYHEHHGVQSFGLRPHTVYGAGRDTGLTSSPTWAMLAAVRGEDFDIPFSGSAGMQHASDVAETFIAAAGVEGKGRTYSICGDVMDMSRLADLINARSSGGSVTVSGGPLPFPADFDESELAAIIGPVPSVGIEAGIDATLAHFAQADPDLLPSLIS